MNKVICTTTINKPTEALLKFAATEGWQMVVAGDVVTPHEKYKDLHLHYLHPEWQAKYDPKLSELIGWRSIQRRNFAFLFACKELNADVVATVDDDNIPLDGWGNNLALSRAFSAAHCACQNEVFDPLMNLSYDDALWHRGFPLQLVSERIGEWGTVETTANIQADLWNGDPDIDAVCRMINGQEEIFTDNQSPLFTGDKPSPFNSQNTFLSRKVMPHYFMFPDVGRWDDIVASYYVQAVGYKVVYGKPSVIQKRNEHDVMEDFKKEVWGYQNTLPLVRDLAKDPDNLFNYLSPRAAKAFRQYQSHFK